MKKYASQLKIPLPNHGYIRVAAAIPPLSVGNPLRNVDFMIDFARHAERKGVSLIVFPELGITGYTAADLFSQDLLCMQALGALNKFREEMRESNSIAVIGLPLRHEGKLFNTAAVVANGKICGIVPKTYIPGYKEFYEERWFASARDATSGDIELFGEQVPFGTDLLFPIEHSGGVTLGIEICEDLWMPLPPSSFQVLHGANIIANLSASNDLVGKAEYRRQLVVQQSARAIAGYIYTSCGVHESTTDVVFGGHAMIAENGSILTESRRFVRDGELIIADIDTEHLAADRVKTTSFGEGIHEAGDRKFRDIKIPHVSQKLKTLSRHIDPFPFVPANPSERDARAKEIFSIQAAGLLRRIEAAGVQKLVIGLSGGLDSTLALLVSRRAAELVGISLKNILAFTMPGFGTTGRTKQNAWRLARALAISIKEIDIRDGVALQLKKIGHNRKNQDTAFENAQARYRTETLMNIANKEKGLVIGTGDLSEIALGWCTYTGDHISHYNVNCSVPKTLVKYLVQWVSETQVDAKTRAILKDILATPISPELTRPKRDEIAQKTEELIGPYELHDFFLYHFVRWGSSPTKILALATIAWGRKYRGAELKRWLRVFLERFFGNQWKRSVATDGPKVGSVSLSPRGDWRMPSDAKVQMWLEELK